jgi:hypothetical protein
MRKFLLFAVFISFLALSGCSHYESDPDALPPASSKSFIELPPKTQLSTENTFFTFKLISGLIGGEIGLNAGYNGPNGLVSINADLNIPSHAFLGLKLISYFINDQYAAVDFFPALTFNHSLTFDLTFTGLDLTGVNPDDVDFCYLDFFGHLHHVQYSQIVVDIPTGTLKVVGAKLEHFSRYIFAR